MEYPKISIVTPSFNKKRFIESAIRSVIEQGYPNLEYLIVDGGSTDGTAEIIQNYHENLAWWVSEPDKGQSHAINKGFERTTGEIMAYLNADDMYCPWALETVAALFMEFPQVEWLTSLRPMIWDDAGRPVMTVALGGFTKACFYAGYTLGCSEHHMGWIQQESTFWRRSLWEKAGGYVSEDLKFAMDFELWARFYEHADLFGVPIPFGGYRVTGAQKSVESIDQYYSEAGAVLARYSEKKEAEDAFPGKQVDDKRWVIDYDLSKRRHELKRWAWPLSEALEGPPKVSVITVCKKDEGRIGRTIESVIAQRRYLDVEHIVVDLTSTSASADSVKKYMKFVDVFMKTADMSFSSAMNEGVKVATGEILLFLDSNAYLADEETITDVVRLFVSNPDVDTVFGNAALDRGKGAVQKRQLHEMNRSLMATRPIALESLFVRKEAFQQTGGFSEMYREAADYDWILRLFLKRPCNYRHIDRLISVRVDEGQAPTKEEKIERRRIIRKYYTRREIFKYRTVPLGVAGAKAVIRTMGLK